MQIIISNQSDVPIYEQIEENIKNMILKGDITGGEMLPSIRSLAKDLHISVITTKRAYEELEHKGFIETIPGKGCFVKAKSNSLLREEIMKKIEEKITDVVHLSTVYEISKEELTEILNYLYEEEKHGK
ncbi:MAG: GntR family transcriptional regulator [Firmicutes bacterium]|nr:GntR family transcriptional regulator [Bacillota bacterium]